MTFQAYIDAVEQQTGKTPAALLDEAAVRGFGPTTKAGVVLEWLAADYGVGRGHAMAFFHLVKNGTTISDRHVGSRGAHRDDSTELRIDGIANRDRNRSDDRFAWTWFALVCTDRCRQAALTPAERRVRS